MRILVISNLYPPATHGGYEILCAQVCEGLARKGHEVAVLSSSARATQESGGPGQELPIWRDLQLEADFEKPVQRSRFQRTRVARHNAQITARKIQEWQPDLIFVWSQLRLSPGAARAAESSLIPTVYTMNDEHWTGFIPANPRAGVRGLVGAACDLTWARPATLHGIRFEHVTAISQVLKDRLLDAGLPASQIEVIHQGIPLETFIAPALEIETPAPAHSEAPFCALYAGQLHHYKGVHTVIEAMHSWKVSQPNRQLELRIAGAGPSEYSDYLHGLAQRGPCDVNFLGRVPHESLAHEYRNADALCFPSIWAEPFGLSYLEAMACGTPVIATPHGGQGEVLQHRHNAWLAAAEQPKEWATALRTIADQPEFAQQLSRNGRELVERDLNLDAYTTRLDRFLQSVLQKNVA